MSYFDPPVPTLQATRFQIQRSILALEEKLRQRKTIDMEIDNLRNEEIEKRLQLDTYYHEPLVQPYIPASFRSPYVQDRYYGELERSRLEEEEKEIIHIDRMRKLGREHLQLNEQRLRDAGIPFENPPPSSYAHAPELAPLIPPYPLERYHNRNDYIAYEEDIDLIRKYEDGTRAKQIRRELDEYRYSQSNSGIKGPRNQWEQYTHPNSKTIQMKTIDQSDRGKMSKYSSAKNSLIKNPQNSAEKKRSPYSKLNHQTNFSTIEQKREGKRNDDHEKLKIFKNQGINSPKKVVQFQDQIDNQEEEEEEEQVRKVKPYNPNPKTTSGKKSSSRSFRKFNLAQDTTFNASFLNQVYKKSSISAKKSSRKTNKKRSTTKISALEKSRSHSRSRIHSMEDSANQSKSCPMPEIKNRLKVSEIIFEDSKFRNIKHEMNHLHMTYDQELKIRKQIKDKINTNPLILRKHAMVVE